MSNINDIYELIDNSDIFKMHHHILTDINILKKSMVESDEFLSDGESIVTQIDFDDKGFLKDFLLPCLERPEIKNFDFVTRYKQTKNITYKAKYALLDWRINNNFDSLKYAIDNYLCYCNEIINNFNNEIEHKELVLTHYVCITFNIIKETSKAEYKLKDILKLINTIITNSLYIDKELICLDICRLIAENHKYFHEITPDYLQNLCVKNIERYDLSDCFIKGFYDLAIKLDNKIKDKKYDINLKMAEYYENQLGDNDDLGSLINLISAIKYYKKSNVCTKIVQLEKRLTKMRTQEILTQIYELELTDEYVYKTKEEVQEKIEKLDHPFHVIKYFNTSTSFSPLIKNIAESSFELSSYVTNITIDDKGHLKKVKNEDETINKFNIAKNYDCIMPYYSQYIIEFLLQSIEQKKLNTSILIQYLQDHSWISKSIEKPVCNNYNIEYNWLEELEIPLSVFFEEVLFFINNKGYIPKFKLFIDTISLKFEGLLRDIFELNNLPIIKYKNDYDTEENNINNYLLDERLENFLPKEDIYFLSWLLVRNRNIRNKVAHCLMLPEDYNLQNAILLFYGLMRVLKMQDIKIVQES